MSRQKFPALTVRQAADAQKTTFDGQDRAFTLARKRIRGGLRFTAR